MGKHTNQLEVYWPGKFSSEGTRRVLTWEEHKRSSAPILQLGNPARASVQIHRGENLGVLAHLRREAGFRPRLIYLDPPYGLNRGHLGKATPVGEEEAELVCYDDNWGEDEDSFAHFLWLRLKACHDVLADDGSLFLHVNADNGLLAEALLSDVFGSDQLLNRIIWHYTGGARSRNKLSNKHDVILWYRKGADYTFNADAIRVPYAPTSGYAKGGIRAKSGKHYAPNPLGTVPDDVWDIPIINPMAKERTGYATQKPLDLMKRIVRMASNPGDLVLDPCCGSGSTLIAAALEGRQGLGIDAEPYACWTGKERAEGLGLSTSLTVHSRSELTGTVQDQNGRYRLVLDKAWRGIEQIELCPGDRESLHQIEAATDEMKAINGVSFAWSRLGHFALLDAPLRAGVRLTLH